MMRFASLTFAVWFLPQLAVAEDAAETDQPKVLEVGDSAPAFEGQTDEGQKWKLRDFQKKDYIVVYFYPADFTTGCTRQAELWRDNMNTLAKKGVQVVGISGDSVKNHKLFKEAWNLNFTLIADEEGQIAKQFGVPVRQRGGRVRPRGPDRKPVTDDQGNPLILERNVTFARWTFVIGKDGKILYKNTKVHPTKDSEQVIEFIESVDQPSSQAEQSLQ